MAQYNLLSEDTVTVAKSLAVMMHNEITCYRICDYLHSPWFTVDDNDTLVTASDRAMIVNWCYNVIDQCHLDPKTIAPAMEMVDRFLSKPSSIARDALLERTQYQLVAMTALYISVKINEKVALNSEFFASVSKGMYSKNDIEGMEMSILQGLSWRIYAPTSFQMAHRILSLTLISADVNEQKLIFILEEIQFQTECAVTDYYFTTKRPSTIALGAIFNALDQVACQDQDKQSILHALLPLVANGKFSSLDEIQAVKNRLYKIMP